MIRDSEPDLSSASIIHLFEISDSASKEAIVSASIAIREAVCERLRTDPYAAAPRWYGELDNCFRACETLAIVMRTAGYPEYLNGAVSQELFLRHMRLAVGAELATLAPPEQVIGATK